MRYLYRYRDRGDGTPIYRCGAYTDDGLTPRVREHAAATARRDGHTIILKRPNGRTIATFNADGTVRVNDDEQRPYAV